MSGERTGRTHDHAREDRPTIVLHIREEHLPQLARLIVEYLEAKRLQDEPQVSAVEVAAFTGLSIASVYRCAERLGGFRVGEGRRAPWRWRLSEVAEAYDPAGYGWLR